MLVVMLVLIVLSRVAVKSAITKPATFLLKAARKLTGGLHRLVRETQPRGSGHGTCWAGNGVVAGTVWPCEPDSRGLQQR